MPSNCKEFQFIFSVIIEFKKHTSTVRVPLLNCIELVPAKGHTTPQLPMITAYGIKLIFLFGYSMVSKMVPNIMI